MGTYLWESMCAVFPNPKAIKKYKIQNGQDLLNFYLSRQYKRKRKNYVDACLDDMKAALEMANSIYRMRTSKSYTPLRRRVYQRQSFSQMDLSDIDAIIDEVTKVH